MPPIETDSLLAPVQGSDPFGPDLEYDVDFASLERDAAGKQEQQIGSTIVKAEDPDWPAVERAARALLARSKDLRVAVHLAKALLRTHAWGGFAAGVGALRELLANSWEGVHPRLDPHDGNDPTARVNILANLADAVTTAAVRATPLVGSRAARRFPLREIEIANGDAPPSREGEAPSMGTIQGVAAEMDLAALEETAASLVACANGLAAVEAIVGEKTGQLGVLAFGRLLVLVRRASAFVEENAALRRPADRPSNGAPAATNGVPTGATARASGEISSREDVIRALDRIIVYYARYEPSSPIPMLIERSKRLVAMSFVEIIKELVPDGVSQVEVLRGRTD
jgi:type VI secretion system protein ImpA